MVHYIPKTYLFYNLEFVYNSFLIEFQEGRDLLPGLDTLYIIMVFGESEIVVD